MENKPLVDVKNLRKLYPIRKGFTQSTILKQKQWLRAVDAVSFQIDSAEIFGLVGETGCGKSTTGRLLARLENPTEGRIAFDGVDITRLKGNELKTFRRRCQMIFQDPYDAFDPRLRIYDDITEPLSIHNIGSSKDERLEMVYDMLKRVGLRASEDLLLRYPHELSGGERQRLALARALILSPMFIVADEPTSMLDVSVRAGVMDTMLRLRKELNVAYLLITHDLSVAGYLTDRLGIMYLGKFCEVSPTEAVIRNPKHPYTIALLSAALDSDATTERHRVTISGDVPSPLNLPKGCRLHPRCPYTHEICVEKEPELEEVKKGHFVACHGFE